MSNEKMNNEKMSEKARRRSNIYGFLAVVYLQEPTDEFVKLLREPDILNALKELGIEINKQFQNMSEEKLLEELTLEYTRLFIGPGKHISPYESVWRDNGGLLWGETTSEVKRFIESLGLKYRSDWSGIPDHIGVELEFMQKLTDREKSAWEQNDKNTALRCLEFGKKFMDEHLSQWIPEFCDRVIKETHISFYRQISNLTKKFIEFDQEEINNYD